VVVIVTVTASDAGVTISATAVVVFAIVIASGTGVIISATAVVVLATVTASDTGVIVSATAVVVIATVTASDAGEIISATAVMGARSGKEVHTKASSEVVACSPLSHTTVSVRVTRPCFAMIVSCAQEDFLGENCAGGLLF
jgi:hypothetical protein